VALTTAQEAWEAQRANRALADPAFWQRLLTADCSPERYRAILGELGNARFSEAAILALCDRLNPKVAEAIRSANVSCLKQAFAKGIVLLEGSALPLALKNVPCPPPALFAWGETDCLAKPMVGIVGTRSASLYGKAAAAKFAEAFAASGVVVVSGGAAGIDAAAHGGALECGGSTVAVLGTGVDRVFPAMNRELFERIRSNGCLLSQFAVGSGALRYHFPARNSLIAMLSDALLVVEAPAKSGALITASAACELGKQVFVVPANITNTGFQGSHALIRDGATLVDHPDQVLEALNLGTVPVRGAEQAVNPVQEAILKSLAIHPMSSEQILAQTGIETTELLSELTLLELEGRVAREAGLYVLRK